MTRDQSSQLTLRGLAYDAADKVLKNAFWMFTLLGVMILMMALVFPVPWAENYEQLSRVWTLRGFAVGLSFLAVGALSGKAHSRWFDGA